MSDFLEKLNAKIEKNRASEKALAHTHGVKVSELDRDSRKPDEVYDHVEQDFGCPSCGETCMDLLIWREDEAGEYVQCTTCREEYQIW